MAVHMEKRASRDRWYGIARCSAIMALVVTVVWHWYSSDLEKHDGYWAGLTVAAVVLSAVLTALTAVAARHDADSGRVPITAGLAVTVWVAGLLWYFAVVFIGFGEACRGTSAACSWECLNQAGPNWQALSVAVVVAATVALLVLLAVSRQVHSRIVDRSAPALVLALFVTAGFLASPHGTETQCLASAVSAQKDRCPAQPPS